MMRFSIRSMENLIERQLRIIDKRLLGRGKRIVYTAILFFKFSPRDFLQRPMRGMLILIDKFAVYHAVFQEFPGINKIGTGFLGQTRRCALRSRQRILASAQLLILGERRIMFGSVTAQKFLMDFLTCAALTPIRKLYKSRHDDVASIHDYKNRANNKENGHKACHPSAVDHFDNIASIPRQKQEENSETGTKSAKEREKKMERQATAEEFRGWIAELIEKIADRKTLHRIYNILIMAYRDGK